MITSSNSGNVSTTTKPGTSHLKKYNTTSAILETTNVATTIDADLMTTTNEQLSSSSSSSSRSPMSSMLLSNTKKSISFSNNKTNKDVATDSSSATTSSSSICKQFGANISPNTNFPTQQLIEELIGSDENGEKCSTTTTGGGGGGGCGSVPKDFKTRLYRIFAEIEKEFDALYHENAILREQLFLINSR